MIKKGKKGKKKKGKQKKKKDKVKIEDVNEKDEISRKISQIYDDEKNELDYEKELKNDNRSFCQNYCFILHLNNILINTFCRGKDYNLFLVKFALLLMTFPLNLTFNAFFFTNRQIQYIYINKNNNISIDWKNLLHSFASSIISDIISIILDLLYLTHSTISTLRKIKNIEEARKKSIWLIKCIKTRIFIYYAFSLVFLLIFGYYVMCFCSIFEKTQLLLLISMFISWAFSLIYLLGNCFAIAFFRFCSLRFKKKCCDKKNLFFTNDLKFHKKLSI